MPDPVIELRGVWRTMDGEPPVHAVRDVDLVVSTGEWWSIMGPSGSGKSTLLNLIGCLDRPTEGHYLFEGDDVGSLSDAQRSGMRANRIGFVFQQFHLLPHRTVTENVMMADVYRRGDRADRRDRAREALDRVGLTDRADFFPTKLSGGERQRVAFARAVMNRPPVLLCDEPTGNLDSVNGAAVLDLLGELNTEGQTIVVVTHDPTVAAVGHETARMSDGALTVDEK